MCTSSIMCKNITNNKFFDIVSVVAPPSLSSIPTFYGNWQVPVPLFRDMMGINTCQHCYMSAQNYKGNKYMNKNI